MNAPAQAPVVALSFPGGVVEVRKRSDRELSENAQDWLKYVAELAVELREGTVSTATAASRLERYLGRANAALSEIGK